MSQDNLHAMIISIRPCFEVSNGYYVPGMGGMRLFWHKIQGQWKQVGHCSEDGCEMQPSYDEKMFPRG